jgi:hypothetical protein
VFLLDSRLVKLSFQGKCRNRIPCSFDPYPWRYFTGMRKLLITAILRSKAVVVYLRDIYIYIYTSLCTYWTNLYVRICIYNYNYIYTWCRLYKCIVWHMLKSDLPYMFLGGSSHQKKNVEAQLGQLHQAKKRKLQQALSHCYRRGDGPLHSGNM